jgi:HD-GYP domain-containing protein (c-di-GMP phosphodiesterase class II)
MSTTLAKSSGVKLSIHSKNVSILAQYIGKTIIQNPEKHILPTIRVAALLHYIYTLLCTGVVKFR